MYEIFQQLLIKKGVTAYKVGKETGIAGSTFTDWKNGRSEPKQDKLSRIAEYFEVSVEYLRTGKESSVVIEMAETDVALSNMNKRMKEYALRLAAMSEDKQKHVMDLIDLLEDKK